MIKPTTNMSVYFQTLIYDKLYFDNMLFPSQCGFHKGYSSAQQCVFVMLENFKESSDKGNELGALLTDISKGFDCIYHKLLCQIILIWSLIFIL